MIRRIIDINEDLCNGCGLCAKACHEGAIAIVNGKAKLMRDDYCDGLGDCLPVCPTGAISFTEREAAEYDEKAVMDNKIKNNTSQKPFAGCPGSMAKTIQHKPKYSADCNETESRLNQWPVQIKLIPVRAPYFDGANLLVAADCSAYAYGNFHNRFMEGHITVIGCPKLDMTDYSEKLTDILKNNDIKSITVTRMEVPCCGGIENAVKTALVNSGKEIPLQVVTISADGRIL